ncbi:response regulator [Microbispora sp. NPDC049125]|uniref:response regulator transcription factor n=1 Tax=Microbispora sp. NPDC049125 TaxID=3154929 RepID=UPI0034652384
MNQPEPRIRVALVDDHALFREGLHELLEMQEDLEVVGQAGDSVSALAMIAEQQPDIILLDVEIPGAEAPDTVAGIRLRSPRSQIIILSMYDGSQLLRRLLAAGVRGYLLKSVHREELISAIRSVHGEPDRIVLTVSRESLAQAQGPAPGVLSDRELQILELAAEALSNSQIATRLALTEATVKRHLRNIFVKLGAVSRIDAVNKAVAAALIAPRRDHPASRSSQGRLPSGPQPSRT